MWTIFKGFVEFVTIWLLFHFLGFFFFWLRGTLAPQPGIKIPPPALEGQTLTIGPPGKSLSGAF